ncbi:MAG: hypothetical protein H7249_09975 [Chitinophagaceae bacterium]|nr:hypothetical protein [Oligoflexus sp.]
MGAKAETDLSKAEFDRVFLEILVEQFRSASTEAASCTASIFELTSNYIDKPEFETLQQFYDLYFANNAKVEEVKSSINDDVDHLFSMLQGQLERGEELNVGYEDEEKKQARLSMAGIQKKLESLITLDGGIRNQILPALASMQCEDAVRQRIEHLIFGWEQITKAGPNDDFEVIARTIAAKTSSIEETTDYYATVLGEKAPEGLVNRSVFIEF